MEEIISNIIGLILGIVVVVAYWKVFVKAGQKGWKAIIPVYNVIILLRIVGKPWWWIILLLIPVVNIVFLALILHSLSKRFGKGGWFTAGLFFLSFIFAPILGFGKATYQGADAVVVKEGENTEDTPAPTPQIS